MTGKGEDLKILRNLFESQGWAFVRMPKDSTVLVCPAAAHLESLFRSPPEKFNKYGWGGHSQRLGLSSTPYKLSFTCPTGTELDKSIESGLPENAEGLRTSVRALVAKLDSDLLKIIQATSVVFFGLSPQALGKKLDIPFLDAAAYTEGEVHQKASFALFDAAIHQRDYC